MMGDEVFPRMIHKVPRGRSGKALVEHFDVTPLQALYSEVMQGGKEWDATLQVGRYARLWVGKDMMMADTHPERVSCLEVVEKARGHVLIAGLGLGMILWPIAAKRVVTSITVLERYADVVKLVQPHIPSRVRVLNVDAFKYRTRRRFDCLFFDIWPLISPVNVIDMKRLHARYAKNLAPGGWMESWQREICERMLERQLPPDAFAAVMGKCGGHITRVGKKAAAQLGCHE